MYWSTLRTENMVDLLSKSWFLFAIALTGSNYEDFNTYNVKHAVNSNLIATERKNYQALKIGF